jgi:hypothetical protein
MRWGVAIVLVAGCDAVLRLEPVKVPPVPTTMWAGVFVQESSGNATTLTFDAHARAVGDAIVVQLGCHAFPNPIASLAVAINAPGWDWQPLEPLNGLNSLGAAMFGAIAPSTDSVMVTVTWSGVASPCNRQSALGDDFTTEGKRTLAFDTHNGVHGGTGDCVGTIRTQTAGAAVWAACNQSGFVTGVDPAYQPGADDMRGNLSSYRLTNDPAGTDEMVDMPSNPGDNFVLDLVTIVDE